MKNRFIVVLNESTSEQDKEFIKYIKSEKIGWWHWIDNLWMLRTTNEKISAQSLRDKIGEIYPSVRIMVFELGEKRDTWSGRGPKTEEKNMFTWIKKNWKK